MVRYIRFPFQDADDISTTGKTHAGPNGFERSYALEGSAGEHDARVVGGIVSRMVAGRS
jgi:hypothetical protein